MKLPKNILNGQIFQSPKILKSKISNPAKTSIIPVTCNPDQSGVTHWKFTVVY